MLSRALRVRHLKNCAGFICAVALVVGFSVIVSEPARGSLDPAIDIHSQAEVEAKRDALVQYIWGIPWSNVITRQPTATDPYTPEDDDALPAIGSFFNLDRVERLVSTMCAPSSSGDRQICHASKAYLFHPRVSNGRVVIVHQGHGCMLDGSDGLSYNLDKTMQALNAAGFAVVGMRMPEIQSRSNCGSTADHNRMFEESQRLEKGSGSPLQFFLEPVARALNYIQAKYSTVYHDFNMVGLSGGGWTSTVYAAIDPRITLSFPVAGSLPTDFMEGRDSEQGDKDFYNIAGYRDLYLLGSFGPNRRQTQILNFHDGCCFRPDAEAAAAYTCQIQTEISNLGPGAFVFYYDRLADLAPNPPAPDRDHRHQIPLAVLSGIILPTLLVGSSGPAPGSCPSPVSWSSGSSLYIVNQGTGKCLDAPTNSHSDQARVEQYSCHEDANQRWFLDQQGEIVNQQSRECLDVSDASIDDQAPVQQSRCNSGLNQRWLVTQRGQIINQNSLKCLDIPNGSLDDHVKLQQFTCNQGLNQRWIFP